MMDGSLLTCIDLVTPGPLFLLSVVYVWLTSWSTVKWILYFVVVGTGLFLPPLFCVVTLRVSCYCNRFIRIEKWIFPSVMWHGKSLLNYSVALMWSTRCAWWLDLQGLLCYEENFEFYDLSGKNGTGSGFCQAHPNCCRKPPNETSKYGTCENSEEQDFIQTSLVWCWKHRAACVALVWNSLDRTHAGI